MSILALAQQEPSEVKPAPVDPLGRSTPRGAILGFLEAAQGRDYDRASQYLEYLPGVGAAQRRETARQLQAVMDLHLSTRLNEVSNEPDGSIETELSANEEQVGMIEMPDRKVPVVLKRVSANGIRVWKISNTTVQQAPALYQGLTFPEFERLLPKPLVTVRFLNLPLWQWLALLAILPIAYGVAWLLSWLVRSLLRPLLFRTSTGADDELLRLAAGPLRLLLAIIVFHFVRLPLGFPVLMRQFLGTVEVLLSILAVTWFALRLIDLAAAQIRERMVQTQRLGAIAIIPLGRRVVKVVAISIAILAMLDNVGFNLTAVVAGLGVGGIAVALAAQRTLENLFGGFSLIADQPVRVGDFCKYGDQVGIVEDIGLRSTRIRTLDRTVVTIPNGQFASMSLENFAKRDKVWFHPTFRLRYETSADQLRYVLAQVRSMLQEHEKVERGSARIRFVSFSNDSLELEIFAYILTADFNEFLAIQEDILLRIMDIVRDAGASFAIPSQTLYLGRDKGLDGEKPPDTIKADDE
ncbi:MAG: mechanosensitive ion channel family protein [Bryobacteraceae bacterium]|nr:mechanosensitive ion channel family protein [Bryobacteraceae bacterium]